MLHTAQQRAKLHGMTTFASRFFFLAAAALALGGCTSVYLPPYMSPPPQQSQPQRLPAPGQVTATGVVRFRAPLAAANVVPPAASAATGELLAEFNRATGVLRFRIQFEGLSGQVRDANFHSPAMEGEVAAPTLSIGRAFNSPYEGRAILSPRQSANLLAGQWYVELRTTRFPEGELRGQMIEQPR